jgi:hypothetical protein
MARKYKRRFNVYKYYQFRYLFGCNKCFFKSNRVTSTQNGYDYRVIITKSDYVCGNIISSSADLIVTPQSNVGITKTVNNATPNVGSGLFYTNGN